VNHGELIKISYGRHRVSQVAQGTSMVGAGPLALLLSLQGWPDISSCHAPLVVLHDAQDEVVPLAQTELLVAGYGRPQGGLTPAVQEMLHRELNHPSSQANGCQITIHENQGPYHPMHGPTTQKCLLRVLEVLSSVN